MADKMNIPIIRNASYTPGDRAEIEINGVVQPDIIDLAGLVTPRPVMPFGGGTFGAGVFGAGAAMFVHRTVARFVAGDYAVRIRSVDPLGNESAWSTARTVRHRPAPPPPTALNVNEAGELAWSWSDP